MRIAILVYKNDAAFSDDDRLTVIESTPIGDDGRPLTWEQAEADGGERRQSTLERYCDEINGLCLDDVCSFDDAANGLIAVVFDAVTVQCNHPLAPVEWTVEYEVVAFRQLVTPTPDWWQVIEGPDVVADVAFLAERWGRSPERVIAGLTGHAASQERYRAKCEAARAARPKFEAGQIWVAAAAADETAGTVRREVVDVYDKGSRGSKYNKVGFREDGGPVRHVGLVSMERWVCENGATLEATAAAAEAGAC